MTPTFSEGHRLVLNTEMVTGVPARGGQCLRGLWDAHLGVRMGEPWWPFLLVAPNAGHDATMWVMTSCMADVMMTKSHRDVMGLW